MRNLSPEQRLEQVASASSLDDEARSVLSSTAALPVSRANGMIENVIGTFQLPLGVATNFKINGKDYLVPMAVEEPSVVAAASFMARIVRGCGGFQTSSTPPIMRAQVQILGIADPFGARLAILGARDEIVTAANAKDPVLVKFGGGCRDIEVHVFPSTSRGAMVVLHLLVDVRDAMGANTVNTMAEAITPIVERITGGEVRLRILSNLADLRLARARLEVTEEALTTKEFSGRRMMEGIMDAYEFAAVDPYRAATHNKGIMNGIDPVVVATGNDWRAIEAGAHAYAARSGRYTSLTTWEISTKGTLVGTVEMPMALGLVGGATKTHPGAQAALQILNVKTAVELAEVTVAVGLAQNMAALRALATEGIQRGHMALHARNIAIGAGAEGKEIDLVASRLAADHDVRSARAEEILAELRM
ncbi:hydroxymethylglutaryl-CoA reductase [Agrobacterium tumefaciens]|uniref:3-hydroxy-3-methylglutaryl coenzyme A reductase n=2 Tax=Agrobacterium TaxID=357 RepID=A0ABR6JFP4_AGRRD|nr:hydroxymethylglutaryl-CoA reductase [Agrobacterium radiobacter]MBB4338299.1 hydroxymethylglutaryl-CoA reductase [Agrobacterium radiobacter]MBB4493187.1 hydroxymethylglutaryl-CoA reductase [Agrobacterium radiobacter]MBB4498460.1 hydroxymethylglutaryl-CoA reductase [Agrobacterium radiobacter]MBB4503841.1 hydroxymethylglutaryl-CoA reductase [Agrobacterium radiobacter]